MSYTPDKQRFLSFLESINVPSNVDRDFLFETFELAIDGADEFKGAVKMAESFNVNPMRLCLYLVNEHIFYLLCHPDQKEEELVKQETYMTSLASLALDKYFTNDHLGYKMGSLTSKFNPSISTIDLYLNFILGMLNQAQKGDPARTLITDILLKGFQMSKCVSDLLSDGFETEAFSTWRTLHENECILHVLLRYGKPVIDAYLKHIRYGIAFRGGIKDKDENDAVFAEIKEGMRAADLKSKDMKKYIEYGWLLAVPELNSIPEFRLNFRDGVERVANLTQYSKVYEMSSEIAHSSPLLIYSRKNYFYSISIVNLYESFFRLEKIFTTVYTSTVSEAEKNNYMRMRTMYYGELLASYEFEKSKFASLMSK